MKIIEKVEEAIAYISRYTLGRDFSQYCDLRTVIELTADDKVRHPSLNAPYILTTQDNNYLSVFEVLGAFRQFNTDKGEGSLHAYINRLKEALTADFKELGHKISIVFEQDPHRAGEETQRLFSGQYAAFSRLQLCLNDIVIERRDKVTPHVARERVYLMVYSALEALPADEQKSEIARQNQLDMPEAQFGQHPFYALYEGLKIRHDSFLDKLALDLMDSNNGVLVRLMDAHEVGHLVRDEIERNSTHENWQPLLPSDRVIPHGIPKDNDTSALMAPHLNYQLCDTTIESSGDIVTVDGLHYGQLAMILGPQQPHTFIELFKTVPRQIAWRMRIDLMPEGAKALQKKNATLSFLAVMPSLRPSYESVQYLLKQDKVDPVCKMSVCFSTWHADKQKLKSHLTMLKKSVQGWGVTSATQTFGDPIRAWASSLPAISRYSGPNLLFPPLSEALRLLPWQRPASPWGNEGKTIFMTPDRKLFPIELASGLQEKHTDIITGTPGSGKSVLANCLNLTFLANGHRELPFLAIIDKGYTAQGLLDLVKESLPEGQKHKALGIVLKNDITHCRNLFDIQLGLKEPISIERSYIIKLLMSLCIDPEKGIPPDAMICRQIIGSIVDLAFKDKAQINRRRYAPGLVPAVDRILQSATFTQKDSNWWQHASWYEVRDMLFDNGFVNEAALAQAQAVPELNDLQSQLFCQEIRDMFGQATRPGTNELMTDFISRCFTTALKDYPLFAGRTQLVVNPETRVVVVDINNVAGSADTIEGKIRTGIMYQFARHLAGGDDFYLPQHQEELYRNLDARYLPLHQKRIEQLDQESKTIFIDELHNIKGIDTLWAGLKNEDREQRKFGVRTVFASQYLEDFPPELIAGANSLYILRIQEKDKAMLNTTFAVPMVTLNALSNVTKGPAADGSGTTFLGIFVTKNGNVAQLLKHVVGPLELWALNSNPADRALRNMLYKELDGKTARALLAKHFPSGSADKHLQALKKKDNQEHDDSLVRQLANELIATLGYLQ